MGPARNARSPLRETQQRGWLWLPLAAEREQSSEVRIGRDEHAALGGRAAEDDRVRRCTQAEVQDVHSVPAGRSQRGRDDRRESVVHEELQAASVMGRVRSRTAVAA